jgi:16S rRNA G966 N2-methylase RsmD
MALTFNDLMFEVKFTNTFSRKDSKTKKNKFSSSTINFSTSSNISLTKKNGTNKNIEIDYSSLSSNQKNKNSIIVDIEKFYFNNEKNKPSDVLDFYKNYPYESIINRYTKINSIINFSQNLEKDVISTLTAVNCIDGINFNLIYYNQFYLSRYWYNYNIERLHKTVEKIKHVQKIPKIIENNVANLIYFNDQLIKDSTITINNYQLIPLNNDNYLTLFASKLIDIMNRYFKHISTEFDVINIGFYIPNINEYTSRNITDLIYTLNRYRILDATNRFEIKYQSDTKSIKPLNNNISVLNKLNFILMHENFFTLKNDILIDYIETKLLKGGNILIFSNIETPPKSEIFRRLTPMFNKVIITKVTIDIPFYWCFIGKGFIYQTDEQYKDYQIGKEREVSNGLQKKVNNFLNTSFDELCQIYDIMMRRYYETLYKKSFKELIPELNKKYIEMYGWCHQNKIETINIFDKKKPKLIKIDELVSYFFPSQSGINARNIKIFDISTYSITLPRESNKICSTIKEIFKGLFDYSENDIDELTVTDAIANVGGSTLSFSKNFRLVNSIERQEVIFEALKHNCDDVYKRKNIKYHLGNPEKLLKKIKQDIIYIDPPLEGFYYRSYDKITLTLNKKNIFTIINELYNSNKALLFVIKCPFNLDYNTFMNNFEKIYIEKYKNFNVMYIIKKKEKTY